jgi:hypothetical protein
LPATALSTAATSTRNRTGKPELMTSRASPSAVAAPPISFFISRMALDGFKSSPPLSKQTPLPSSVTLG